MKDAGEWLLSFLVAWWPVWLILVSAWWIG
jgi:hypothetical protein